MPTLLCIDRDYDSTTSYKGAIVLDVNHKAFQKQDIISN